MRMSVFVEKPINEARNPWSLYLGNLWSNTGITNMLHRVQVSSPNAIFGRLLKQGLESGKKKFCDELAMPAKSEHGSGSRHNSHLLLSI